MKKSDDSSAQCIVYKIAMRENQIRSSSLRIEVRENEIRSSSLRTEVRKNEIRSSSHEYTKDRHLLIVNSGVASRST